MTPFSYCTQLSTTTSPTPGRKNNFKDYINTVINNLFNVVGNV